ncbi:hypothetical protein EV385_1075 [Krasilnikovia cinnamomea]|uniref:Uncharacterized protein n=1 Tax=Krasilnikovia cinnamomea TaxID=349313 RepID=A0A4Q7ZF04_9ACTN|nr:hypothetical protein [Krasilnikovia cinnamomea]RZU49330.1 hypothetical protein EV385_1075 [Krasilnikovia cinnamomea]
MSGRPKPILAVRLIGPAEIAATQARYLAAYLAKSYSGRATCHTSTRPARNPGEIRVYLTVTPMEALPR